MGYTHYWYRKQELDRSAFLKIIEDFKKLLPALLRTGIQLGNGMGRGKPVLTSDEAIFNGLESCGHPVNHSVTIPWPSEHAGGVGAAGQALIGTWHAGSVLLTRCCNGDCSYETFRNACH